MATSSNAANGAGPSRSKSCEYPNPPEDLPSPVFVTQVSGVPDRINAVKLLRSEDGFVTVSDDKTVRFWLLRETGQYWPSICHTLPAACKCMHLEEGGDTSRLFVGLDNGIIVDLCVAEDMNSLSKTRDLSSHSSGVCSVVYSSLCDLLLSVGKDRHLVVQDSQTGRRIASFNCGAWAIALAFDELSKMAFVGDYSGHMYVLKIRDEKCEMVSRFQAHSGSVRSVCWDSSEQLLVSGGADHSLFVWNIGAKDGTFFQLTGQVSKVCSVNLTSKKRRLFAADDSGLLAVWNMNAERQSAPEWLETDACQLCSRPFFWNVKEMWDKKVVGLRQHHCRLCGKAVCDVCSTNRVVYPPMGFEIPSRTCDLCKTSINENTGQFVKEPKSLAMFHKTEHNVICIDVLESKGKLLTVGGDRIVKVWDVSKLVQ